MSSNPPASGSSSDEPDTSQMKAVPAEPDVVWPEDPFVADGGASDEPSAAGEPQVTSPAIPAWPESQFGEPSTPAGHQQVKPLDDDPHTTPFPTRAVIPPWPEKTASDPGVGKTQPPAAAKTVPPAHDNGAESAVPTTDVADTAPPAKTEPVIEAVAGTPEPEPEPEPEPAPEAEPVSAEAPPEIEHPDEPAPVEAVEPDGAEAVYEPEPRTDEPVSEPDMPAIAAPSESPSEPAAAEADVREAEPEPAPAAAAPAPSLEPEPEPVKAEAEPPAATPATGPSEHDRLAAEAAAAFAASSSNPPAGNPAIPSWAPKLDAPQSADKQVQWPGSSLPSWAPIPGGPAQAGEPQRVRVTSTSQPAPAPAQQSAPPVQPAAPAPPVAAPRQPPGSRPPAAAPGASAPPKPSSSWEIVPQKTEAKPLSAGPTAEDKSYAEWFAWAKRSGAPASACHAAAQGAFRALSGGQDMATAVKWATVAMASPPGLVGQARQLYCAWFSLGNIDLQLPTPQAHTFATAAIQALDSGADSMVAHQLGLQAAGVTPR